MPLDREKHFLGQNIERPKDRLYLFGEIKRDKLKEAEELGNQFLLWWLQDISRKVYGLGGRYTFGADVIDSKDLDLIARAVNLGMVLFAIDSTVEQGIRIKRRENDPLCPIEIDISHLARADDMTGHVIYRDYGAKKAKQLARYVSAEFASRNFSPVVFKPENSYRLPRLFQLKFSK